MVALSSAIDCTKGGIRHGKSEFPSFPSFLSSVILTNSANTDAQTGISRLLDLCLSTHSILIAPAYRLLPEANARDVLTDVELFWHWLRSALPSLTTTWRARPDLNRLACAGSSAGGYLAVQSALLFPQLSRIKFLISLAGSLYTDIPYYRIPGPKVILGKIPPPPWKAERIIRDYVRNIKPGAVRTSGDPIEMWEFLMCVLQQAYLARWLGMKGDERLDVMGTLEKTKAMPPIWIVQGTQDSVVSCPPMHSSFERRTEVSLAMLMILKCEGPSSLLY